VIGGGHSEHFYQVEGIGYDFGIASSFYRLISREKMFSTGNAGYVFRGCMGILF
jgi:hypothetical protein